MSAVSLNVILVYTISGISSLIDRFSFSQIVLQSFVRGGWDFVESISPAGLASKGVLHKDPTDWPDGLRSL
jgi:hypothetical protein